MISNIVLAFHSAILRLDFRNPAERKGNLREYALTSPRGRGISLLGLPEGEVPPSKANCPSPSRELKQTAPLPEGEDG